MSYWLGFYTRAFSFCRVNNIIYNERMVFIYGKHKRKGN